MRKRNIIIYSTILIFVFSCKNNLINKDLEIKGYSIGDSISSDFQITHESGESFKFVKFKNDTMIKASSIGNHISSFHINQPIDSYEQTLKKISQIFGEPKLSYVGDTIYGIKLNAFIEYNMWANKSTKYSVKTIKELGQDEFYIIQITNDSINDLLKTKYIKNDEKPIQYNEFERRMNSIN